jgi:hypothetical protein
VRDDATQSVGGNTPDMPRGKRRWLWILGGAAVVVLAGLTVAGWILSRRFEPFLREQTIAWLSQRFDSQVRLGALHVSMPLASPVRALIEKGKGAMVRIQGRDLEVRGNAFPQPPPLLAIRAFRFEVELNSLWNRPALVRRVRLDGLVVNVPPTMARAS